MPRYSALWLEIARAQYDAYPSELQRQIDAKVELLLENPEAYGSYDERTDQWTTTFGGGIGLIVYAVVRAQLTIVILRLV